MLVRPISRFQYFCHSLAKLKYQNKKLLDIFDSHHQAKSLAFIRAINTTNKKKDGHIEVYDPEYINVKKPPGPKTAKEFADLQTQKNWISFGFNPVNIEEDRRIAHLSFFIVVSVGMVWFSWLVWYFPDTQNNDWIIREAFLELDRRERLGLPLVDPNMIDPAKITLPSEEELAKIGIEIHL